MNSQYFADKLKLLRKSHNLNQIDVAEAIGIARQTYSNYETGKRIPDGELMIKLAEFYEISLAELLSPSVTGEKRECYSDQYLYVDAQNMDAYMEFIQKATRRTHATFTHFELQLLFYFERLSKNDKEEILELARMKFRRHNPFSN